MLEPSRNSNWMHIGTCRAVPTGIVSCCGTLWSTSETPEFGGCPPTPASPRPRPQACTLTKRLPSLPLVPLTLSNWSLAAHRIAKSPPKPASLEKPSEPSPSPKPEPQTPAAAPKSSKLALWDAAEESAQQTAQKSTQPPPVSQLFPFLPFVKASHFRFHRFTLHSLPMTAILGMKMIFLRNLVPRRLSVGPRFVLLD